VRESTKVYQGSFADLYQFKADKKTCGTVACAIAHENTIKLRSLYKAKAPKRANLKIPGQSMPYLHQAVKCNTTQVLQTLIDLGADISEKDDNGNTALHFAILEGRQDMVDTLLQHTDLEDIWVRGQNQATPLDFALQSEGFQLVHQILQFAFNPAKASGDTEKAIAKGRDALNYVAYKDSTSPVLHRAVLAGDVDVVKAILSKGAKVDLKDSGLGRTALHVAAWSRDLKNPEEMTTALIEGGATVDARDNNGQTPLSTAACVGNTRAATTLLAHKADIETKLTHGLVVLHVACYWGRLELVEILLDRGANVNALCTSENDALVQVAMGHLEKNLYPIDTEISLTDTFKEYTQIVRLLLGHEANARTRNISQKTALHIALENVASFLIKRIGYQLNEEEGEEDDEDEDEDEEDEDEEDDEDEDEDEDEDDEDEDEDDEDDEDEDDDIDDDSLKIYHSEMRTGFSFYAGIARLLLNKGADINNKDEEWKTLLHVLCEGPFKFISSVGAFALHPRILESVFQGYTDLIEMVLVRKGDINAKDDRGRTPLDLVLESRDKLKKEFPEEELSPRVEGAVARFTDIAKVLKNANGKIGGSTAYQQQSAAKPGRKTQQTPSKATSSRQTGSNAPAKNPYDYTQLLSTLMMSAGAISNCNCADCARMRKSSATACAPGKQRTAKATKKVPCTCSECTTTSTTSTTKKKPAPSTVKRTSNVDESDDDDDDELRSAVAAGDLEAVQRILQDEEIVSGLHKRENRDASGNTVLHIAVEAGHENVTRALLRNGCLVTPKNDLGQTALHVAITKKNKVMVRMLLFRGWKRAKPNLLGLNYKDAQGDTALHLAVDSDDNDILDMVLKREPNLELLGSKGRTALYMAVRSKNGAAVESLLSHGAEIEQDLPRGETLLHVVARMGNRVNIGRVLLKHDAKNVLLNAVDSRNRTALDVAIEYNKPNTIKFLKARGGV
jgi:serine/threonine-protein phosphatase 6 regulatory ankyrin repeat subunit A